MSKGNTKINTYVIWDTETGGLSPKKNPLMEVALNAIDGTTLTDILRYDDLVQPYDDALVYDKKALQINGLTVEKCKKEGLPLEQVVENMCQFFKEAHVNGGRYAKPILVAHNAGFDDQYIEDAFWRCGKDLSDYIDGWTDKDGIWHPHSIDSEDWAKLIHAPHALPTDNFKFGSACERAGIQLFDGHRALADVMALSDLFRYYVTRLRSGSNDVQVSNGKAIVNTRKSFEW